MALRASMHVPVERRVPRMEGQRAKAAIRDFFAGCWAVGPPDLAHARTTSLDLRLANLALSTFGVPSVGHTAARERGNHSLLCDLRCLRSFVFHPDLARELPANFCGFG